MVLIKTHKERIKVEINRVTYSSWCRWGILLLLLFKSSESFFISADCKRRELLFICLGLRIGETRDPVIVAEFIVFELSIAISFFTGVLPSPDDDETEIDLYKFRQYWQEINYVLMAFFFLGIHFSHWLASPSCSSGLT